MDSHIIRFKSLLSRGAVDPRLPAFRKFQTSKVGAFWLLFDTYQGVQINRLLPIYDTNKWFVISIVLERINGGYKLNLTLIKYPLMFLVR